MYKSCQNFFTFTFQAVAITFVQVTAQIMQNWENHTWISFETGFIFLSLPKLHLRFCSVARRPPASEEGGKVALSQLPPFLGFEQKYLNGEFLEHWKIMCQFAEAVVSTSEEKKAPPYMERLQKEHCTLIWKCKLFKTNLLLLLN